MPQLPFTPEQFLAVFAAWNQAIWPAQVLAYALGLLALGLCFSRRAWAGRLVGAILAVLWLGNGLGYHMAFFTAINPAAWIFGSLFVLQGLLFLGLGALAGRISFAPRRDLAGVCGGVFVVYALVVYPLLGAWWGHGWPHSPLFGVAPCPTTIFTFGILLWSAPGMPRSLLAIPLVWSLIGFFAALNLGISEDLGLMIAGVLGTVLLLPRREAGERLPQAGG